MYTCTATSLFRLLTTYTEYFIIYVKSHKILLMPSFVTTCQQKMYKKAVLPQGNRAMPQVFFSVEVRQQHSLQV